MSAARKARIPDPDYHYHEALAALDELEGISLPILARRQIAQAAARVRRALSPIQASIEHSPYFRDAYPLAALQLEDGAKRSAGAGKTNRKLWADHQKPPKRKEPHSRTEEALKLLREQRKRFPRKALSAYDAVARAMSITPSYLEKQILTPARRAGLLPDYRRLR